MKVEFHKSVMRYDLLEWFILKSGNYLIKRINNDR